MGGLIFSQINVIYLFFQRKCSSGVTSICSRSHTMRKKNSRTTKKSIFSETKKKQKAKIKSEKTKHTKFDIRNLRVSLRHRHSVYPLSHSWFVKEVDCGNQNIIMLPLLIIKPFQGRDLRSSDFTLCQVLHAL